MHQCADYACILFIAPCLRLIVPAWSISACDRVFNLWFRISWLEVLSKTSFLLVHEFRCCVCSAQCRSSVVLPDQIASVTVAGPHTSAVLQGIYRGMPCCDSINVIYFRHWLTVWLQDCENRNIRESQVPETWSQLLPSYHWKFGSSDRPSVLILNFLHSVDKQRCLIWMLLKYLCAVFWHKFEDPVMQRKLTYYPRPAAFQWTTATANGGAWIIGYEQFIGSILTLTD